MSRATRLSILLFILFSACCGGALSLSRPTGGNVASPSPAPARKASAEAQAQREAAITQAQRAGIFGAIEGHRLRVKPAFYGVPFDQKQQFVSVVWAWDYDIPRGEASGADDSQVLYLVDEFSGKEVGCYGKLWAGLRMY